MQCTSPSSPVSLRLSRGTAQLGQAWLPRNMILSLVLVVIKSIIAAGNGFWARLAFCSSGTSPSGSLVNLKVTSLSKPGSQRNAPNGLTELTALQPRFRLKLSLLLWVAATLMISLNLTSLLLETSPTLTRSYATIAMIDVPMAMTEVPIAMTGSPTATTGVRSLAPSRIPTASSSSRPWPLNSSSRIRNIT